MTMPDNHQRRRCRRTLDPTRGGSLERRWLAGGIQDARGLAAWQAAQLSAPPEGHTRQLRQQGPPIRPIGRGGSGRGLRMCAPTAAGWGGLPLGWPARLIGPPFRPSGRGASGRGARMCFATACWRGGRPRRWPARLIGIALREPWDSVCAGADTRRRPSTCTRMSLNSFPNSTDGREWQSRRLLTAC